MIRNSSTWQVVIHVDSGGQSAFAEHLEPAADGVSAFETAEGSWTITALYRARPDIGVLGAELALIAASEGVPEPSLSLSEVPHADWLALAYAGFPARRVDRFYIYGSHLSAAAAPGAVGLKIDAATAFGSGEHATTEGCLRATGMLERSGFRPSRVLDMGTGSGILSVAAAKTWRRAAVAAIDIDPESARVAAANARLNGVGGRVHARQGNGYQAPLARNGPPFDLILANILAKPLIRMAPDLHRRLASGGIAVLSGLLRRQERAVRATHRAAGLVLVARRPVGEWQTLILRRK